METPLMLRMSDVLFYTHVHWKCLREVYETDVSFSWKEGRFFLVICWIQDLTACPPVKHLRSRK